MRKRALYAGTTVRSLRLTAGWTQLELARRLRLSTSYLNQIENNQRPITATALVGLSTVFHVDVAAFSGDEGDKLVVELREAFSDSTLSSKGPTLAELTLAAQQTPEVARAFISMQGRHRELIERHQALADAYPLLDINGASSSSYDEVRDFFHSIGNYVDALDRAGEHLSVELSTTHEDVGIALVHRLKQRHNVSTKFDMTISNGDRPIRVFDRSSGKLLINGTLARSSQIFTLACQCAVLEQAETIENVVKGAGFLNAESNAICSIALANYFAGATVLPYRQFLDCARQHRHDVSILGMLFGTSIEQVCHRLSTMQRPNHEGIPFYFLRVDRAGNITKRHSATRFRFARYGGACPLWNVHEAFERPDRMLVQIAEMPDGVQYLSFSCCVTKLEVGFREPIRRYALGVGCEIAYADQIVYGDAVNKVGIQSVAKIGVNCRICERTDCSQRAFPPTGQSITVDHDIRSTVPYTVHNRARSAL